LAAFLAAKSLLGTKKLALLLGVKTQTVFNWRAGRKPKHWNDVVRVCEWLVFENTRWLSWLGLLTSSLPLEKNRNLQQEYLHGATLAFGMALKSITRINFEYTYESGRSPRLVLWVPAGKVQVIFKLKNECPSGEVTLTDGSVKRVECDTHGVKRAAELVLSEAQLPARAGPSLVSLKDLDEGRNTTN
jgi:hypothetical protein